MINLTLPTELIYQVTDTCFTWCKEQNFIYERNLEINDLSLIVVAAVTLVIHNLIYNHSEQLKAMSGLDEEQISKVYDITGFLPLIMLIFHIIYMVFFR